jgi:gamma-D-glutamyl-L-lysine dipeptidyl-peptidase
MKRASVIMCSWEAEKSRKPAIAVVSCPVASLRARPNPRSELVTQEVFGKSVLVAATRAGWALVETAGGGDSSRGWVGRRYLSFPDAWHPRYLVIKRFATLRSGRESAFVLPMGSRLVPAGRAGSAMQVRLPGGGEGQVAARDLGMIVARRPLAGLSAIVRQVVGTPYLWGGTSTFGFDCSGLVQFVFALVGMHLPRNSYEQAKRGRRVGRLDDLRPLDLVFFATRGAVDHVAIHLGSKKILHASGCVRIESLDPASKLFRADLASRLELARRVVES